MGPHDGGDVVVGAELWEGIDPMDSLNVVRVVGVVESATVTHS